MHAAARSRGSWLYGLVLGLWLAALPAAAQTEPTSIAVGTVRGPAAVAVRAALRAELASTEGLALDAPSRATFVVEARVRGRRGHRTTTLRLREGRALRATSSARGTDTAALADALHELLGALPLAPSTTPPEAVATSSPVEPIATPAETSAPSVEPGLASPSAPILTIAVALAARGRTADVTLDGGAHRTFEASPYVDLSAEVEVRPFASDPSLARGLYARGEAGGALGLRARSATTSTDATFYRLAATVGYLAPLSDALELGGGVGLGLDHFGLGDGQILPTIELPYVRVEVRARARLFGEALVLVADGGYRALLARDGLGAAFGPEGSSFGWDLRGGVAGVIDPGLFYEIVAGYTQYVHAFAGGDAVRAVDGSYAVTVALGYALR